MRYLTLLALTLLLCSSGAFCQMNSTGLADINASALRSLVVDSSAKLESYSFSMEMAQNIDLVNLSSMKSQRLYTRSIGLGLANMTDRALKLIMASLTYAQGDEENSSAVALEEYLLNDTIYIKLDGNWTVLKMPGAAAAWSQQSALEQQVNMFNRSNLILIGTETVEGQDCYKVRAGIDTHNTTDRFSNTTLDIYYWITKDTHLLKKTNVHEVRNVTPQSLGLPAAIGQKVQLDSTTSMLFAGFNESVNIMLPYDAGKSQLFPLALPASNETAPVDSNESVVGPRESISNTSRISESIQNAAGLSESAPTTPKLIESKSRLSESISKLSGSIPNAAESNESMLNAARSNEPVSNAAKSNEPIPNTANTKLNESKSRLSESVSRLNKSMPDAARLNRLKLRLNATMPNAALQGAKISNATSSNATLSNATLSNATLSNATIHENRTIQAASTPWRIFL